MGVYQGELDEYATFIRTSRALGAIMKDMTKKRKERFINGNTSLNKLSSKGGARSSHARTGVCNLPLIHHQ